MTQSNKYQITWIGAIIICATLLSAAYLATIERGVKHQATGQFDRLPQPDSTGMVPGDLLLGNLFEFPGHAGIYIGRWQDLPQTIQDSYTQVYAGFRSRSGDSGLANSFLVVDSEGDRGVALSSFAEQFTDFFPFGSQRRNFMGAADWEKQIGAAISWPELNSDDQRRWLIVTEALQMVADQVPYPNYQLQLETAFWHRFTPYSGLRKIGIDCISLPHLAYQRGAGLDIDVSLAPYHTPQQLFSYAQERALSRRVNFTGISLDARILGQWNLKWIGKTGSATLTVEFRNQEYVALVDGQFDQHFTAEDIKLLSDQRLQTTLNLGQQRYRLFFRPSGRLVGIPAGYPNSQIAPFYFIGHK